METKGPDCPAPAAAAVFATGSGDPKCPAPASLNPVTNLVNAAVCAPEALYDAFRASPQDQAEMLLMLYFGTRGGLPALENNRASFAARYNPPIRQDLTRTGWVDTQTWTFYPFGHGSFRIPPTPPTAAEALLNSRIDRLRSLRHDLVDASDGPNSVFFGNVPNRAEIVGGRVITPTEQISAAQAYCNRLIEQLSAQ